MKIKEVCTKTGLTEKAVRYYVENGLCSPQEYESRDRKYLNFTEENLTELKNIAVMRKLGFSIEDIRLMKTDGGKIEGVMNRYIRSLSEELEIKNRIFSSLVSEDYSETRSIDELMPKLAGVLRPDPADPDFSKFEKDIFDDGRDGGFSELETPQDRFAKIEEIFITYTAVIGTLMALTTLPGIIMFIIAALIFRKVRADYMTMYKVLSGIGFLSNSYAFIRAAGGLSKLLGVFSGGIPDFAVMQCRFHLVAAAAELISLLILIFGRNIKEHF